MKQAGLLHSHMMNNYALIIYQRFFARKELTTYYYIGKTEDDE